MRVRDVGEWKDQPWTCLYEAALFENDTVKLCVCLWEAQSAIVARIQEIQGAPSPDPKERVALEKAMGILSNLRRLSGLDQENYAPPRRALTHASLRRVRSVRAPYRSAQVSN
jgi:hypothetical protein